jgi:CheY-like chemotaxis protein
MLTFLIVEDRLDNLNSMKEYLEREFPGALIHTAQTTEAAADILNRAEKAGLAYNVVILDFKLPPRKGMDAVIDLDTRRRVQTSAATEGAAVFHITGFGDDPAIQEWVREERLRNPLAPEPFPINKGDKTRLWTETLYEAIRRVVYESRIMGRMVRLFGEQVGRQPSSAARWSALPDSLSTTQDLSALARDIELHWPYLSEGVRKRVRRVFPLEADGNSVRITLL